MAGIIIKDYLDENGIDIIRKPNLDSHAQKTPYNIHLTFYENNFMKQEELKESLFDKFAKEHGEKINTFIRYKEKYKKLSFKKFYNPLKKDFYDLENLLSKIPIVISFLMEGGGAFGAFIGGISTEGIRTSQEINCLKKMNKNEEQYYAYESLKNLENLEIKTICIPEAKQIVDRYKSNDSKSEKNILYTNAKLKEIYQNYISKI
jgi:hypothetical protein